MSTYLTPFAVAALTATSSVMTSDAAPSAPWYTPLFGPGITIMSAIIAYIVSHQVLKVRLQQTEHRLDRLEPKIDRIADIAERLARMEGQIATR